MSEQKPFITTDVTNQTSASTPLSASPLYPSSFIPSMRLSLARCVSRLIVFHARIWHSWLNALRSQITVREGGNTPIGWNSSKKISSL